MGTKKIIDSRLLSKSGQFAEEELDVVLKKKLKAEKLQGSTKYL